MTGSLEGSIRTEIPHLLTQYEATLQVTVVRAGSVSKTRSRGQLHPALCPCKALSDGSLPPVQKTEERGGVTNVDLLALRRNRMLNMHGDCKTSLWVKLTKD